MAGPRGAARWVSRLCCDVGDLPAVQVQGDHRGLELLPVDLFLRAVLHHDHLLRGASLDQDAPAVRLQAEVVEEPRRHQHRHVAPAQGHQRAGAGVPGGPEGVGDLRAGPQSRPPRLRSGRDGIDGAGGEQYVPAGRGLRAVVRVGMGAHRPLPSMLT